MVAHFVWSVAAAGGIAEAELAARACAPAFDGCVIEQRAGVETARRNEACAPSAAESYGREDVAHLAGLVAARSDVSQAEPPVGVVAPTLERAVVEYRAAMRESASEAGCVARRAEIHDG